MTEPATRAFDVRSAVATDVAVVNELLTELGYVPEGDLVSRLDRWNRDDCRWVLLAESGQQVVGLLAMSISPRLESDSWWAQTVALVVAPSARHQGAATRLLARAEAIAREAGCDVMVINSSRDRVPAQSFYAGSGYRDRSADHAQFIRGLNAK